jgi:hypothetical protein
MATVAITEGGAALSMRPNLPARIGKIAPRNRNSCDSERTFYFRMVSKVALAIRRLLLIPSSLVLERPYSRAYRPQGARGSKDATHDALAYSRGATANLVARGEVSKTPS